MAKNKEMPGLVSVITVTMNNLAGLRQTVNSVLGQDWPELELIVVDGDSADGTREFLQQNPAVSKWTSEKDEGIYDAQNKGLSMASGLYVIFLNAGDWFYKQDAVSMLMQQVKKGRELIFGNILLQDSLGNLNKKDYPWPLPPHFFDYDTLPQCITLIPSRLIKRRGGLNAALKICADWQFFREVVLADQAKIIHEPKALAVFDTGGISGKPHIKTLIEEERMLVKKRKCQ